MRSFFDRPLFRRYIPLSIAATVVAIASVALIAPTQRTYITRNPSVSQRFVSVPSEAALVDLCYRLQGVYGVTGVSYRDYNATAHTALVTLFFDPQETSVRQLKIFMLHTKILWQQEMIA